MKLCPGVWCPSTILFVTISLSFLLFCGSFFGFYSLVWFFNTQANIDHIYDIQYYITSTYKVLALYLLIFFALSASIYSIILTLKLLSVHPETPKIFPKLKLWTPNNGYLGIQSFSFGSVSGWTLLSNFPPAWSRKRNRSSYIMSIFLFIVLLPIIIEPEIPIKSVIETSIIGLGIYVVAFLLGKLLKNVHFFNVFINHINWLSALIISISLILIASFWIIYIPILSVSLIIMAVGNLYFLKPAQRLLTPVNFELPEPPLVPETVVPQKGY